MRLLRLKVERYRSLRDVDVTFGALNVLIGANASGKSNLVDALNFLSMGVKDKDFGQAVAARGEYWLGRPRPVGRLRAFPGALTQGPSVIDAAQQFESLGRRIELGRSLIDLAQAKSGSGEDPEPHRACFPSMLTISKP